MLTQVLFYFPWSFHEYAKDDHILSYPFNSLLTNHPITLFYSVLKTMNKATEHRLAKLHN